MGHYCKICGRIKPNEKFSGKGHKNHICKECSKRPKDEIDSIQREDEILGFLEQSHISSKNISRLKLLMTSKNKKISELAQLILAVSKITPYKKRRYKILAEKDKNLLMQLENIGLVSYDDYN